MGFYVLAPDVALRSWEGTPYAYVRRFVQKPFRLSPREFALALECDGAHDLPNTFELESLLQRGVIQPCERGTQLSPEQRHRSYPCRVMPWLGLEITGRCNYNCLHCFNAADNAPLTSELSLEQVNGLLDEAEQAGMRAVLISGGEPLVHRHFADIVRAIYEHGMFVHELNTNGRLLTHEVFELFRSLGYLPEFKISFDGLGYHDWMRNHKGAEEETLRAIQLCLDEGARVRIQMNANRCNQESIRPSIEHLARMGVQRIRVICTTDTPRWVANAPGSSFNWDEFQQLALDTSGWYATTGLATELCFWQTITVYPRTHSYTFNRVHYNSRSYRPSRPLCTQLNGMVSIGANGQVYPCLQYSGTMSAWGVTLGNALEEGLLKLMQEGPYSYVAHACVADRLAHKVKCADCKWLTWCAGGCPALAYLFSEGDFLAHDPSACRFFEDGWFDRFAQALEGWACRTPLV
ncbi:MAG: radical SAM protein [Coriobacteriales bacterium]|nr:radical SAM protein [Coriobacteriales bacterium]